VSSFNGSDLTRALAKLRRLLTQRLDDEELRTACFDIGVSFNALRGDNIDAKIRELIAYLQRHNQVPQLLEWMQECRTDIELPAEILAVIDKSSPVTNSGSSQNLDSRLRAAFCDPRYESIVSHLPEPRRRDFDELIRDIVYFSGFDNAAQAIPL